ncbi:hypothetical protein VNO78_20040 [Psophocarpus tetragonolobus]|uniref:CASP-like protein n=1 Tax=Psophocarpus tetragonolobus TaxID=3891 RepID=A0AAN9SCM8_PSOTE
MEVGLSNLNVWGLEELFEMDKNKGIPRILVNHPKAESEVDYSCDGELVFRIWWGWLLKMVKSGGKGAFVKVEGILFLTGRPAYPEGARYRGRVGESSLSQCQNMTQRAIQLQATEHSLDFERKMKDFSGTPGTVLGLALRMSQFIFAAGSIAAMATTPNFFNFTAFCYLIASMGLQVIWSFVLALLDAYALVRKKVLHNAVLVSLFVVGDWVTATLSLAAASSSAGITVLYFNDLGHCHFGEECQKYQISVALAFLSWFPISISSLIMLWLLAAG